MTMHWYRRSQGESGTRIRTTFIILRMVERSWILLVADIRFTDVPFPRDNPVKHLPSGRDLVDLKVIDVRTNCPQRFPYPMTGNAAADRVYLGCKGKYVLAGTPAYQSFADRQLTSHDAA
jgi:hypothetical protein